MKSSRSGHKLFLFPSVKRFLDRCVAPPCGRHCLIIVPGLGEAVLEIAPASDGVGLLSTFGPEQFPQHHNGTGEDQVRSQPFFVLSFLNYSLLRFLDTSFVAPSSPANHIRLSLILTRMDSMETNASFLLFTLQRISKK